ncbi:hypothetical protein HQQ80_21680 [Microbacteriaceae bacterium VKM Ac-2855]|nr:hypothetical protein [Microbacteriaceae bacterium VKM Ac-2855]
MATIGAMIAFGISMVVLIFKDEKETDYVFFVWGTILACIGVLLGTILIFIPGYIDAMVANPKLGPEIYLISIVACGVIAAAWFGHLKD